MKIPVFERQDLEQPIGYTEVEQLELEFTQLKPIHFATNGGSSSLSNLYAGLSGVALPIRIRSISGAETIENQVRQELNKTRNQGRFLMTETAKYELLLHPDQMLIQRQWSESTELLYGIAQTDQPAIQHLAEQLLQIHRWEQIDSLRSPRRLSFDPDQVDLRFNYLDYDDAEQSFTFGPADAEQANDYQIRLPYDPELGGIPYSFAVQNNTENELFYYLVHLDHKFGIQQKNENYLKGYYPQPVATEIYDSYSHNTGLGIADEQVKEVLDRFLLVMSKEQLSIPYVFEQRGFGSHYGKVLPSLEEWENSVGGAQNLREEVTLRKRTRANWAVKRIEVKTTRL